MKRRPRYKHFTKDWTYHKGRMSLSEAMIAKLVVTSDEHDLVWLPIAAFPRAEAGRRRGREGCVADEGACVKGAVAKKRKL
jgi:hypothetical protein